MGKHSEAGQVLSSTVQCVPHVHRQICHSMEYEQGVEAALLLDCPTELTSGNLFLNNEML